MQGLLQGRQDPVCCYEHQKNSEVIRIVEVALVVYLHGDGLHVCLARSCHASQLSHATSIDETEYLCAQKQPCEHNQGCLRKLAQEPNQALHAWHQDQLV